MPRTAPRSGAPLKFAARRPADVGPALFDEAVPSASRAKNACLDRLLALLDARGAFAADGDRTQARLVLDELLVNAMEHGHRWRASRRVRVTLMADRAAWGVRVEDSGRGFDPARIADPTAPDAILNDRGRGLLLVRALMDRVQYYDQGRGVLAVKRLATGRRPESPTTGSGRRRDAPRRVSTRR